MIPRGHIETLTLPLVASRAPVTNGIDTVMEESFSFVEMTADDFGANIVIDTSALVTEDQGEY